jgi:hypothetical protein
MSYTTLKSKHTALYGVGDAGSTTLSPAWIALGALVVGGLLYSQKSKPMKRNGRRSRRLRRRSSRR